MDDVSSAATQSISKNNASLNLSERPAIEDVSSWILMGSPYPIVGIVIFYLYFVLKLGPNYMKSKEPYNLKLLIILYNTFQVCLNAWLVYFIVKRGTVSYLARNWCEPLYKTSFVELQAGMAYSSWWYFFAKVIDLLDTVFFVLRKKSSQITFLHVYHHTIMAFFTWVHVKYGQGEQALCVGLLNCSVHVIMYTYYSLAALGPKYHKYLWWKKYLTWIQMVQFCTSLIYHAAVLAYDCNLNKSITYFFMSVVFSFLVLFSLFYMNTYTDKSKKIKP